MGSELSAIERLDVVSRDGLTNTLSLPTRRIALTLQLAL